MKYILSTIIALLMTISLSAQEEYIFNQYFLNPGTINPGAVGFDGNHNILFNYRNTWSGFPDAPKTYMAHYNGQVVDNVGIGATLLSDNYASLSSIRGAVSFAYVIKGESYNIGVGLSAQYQQYGVSNSVLSSELTDSNDPDLLRRLDDGQFFESALGAHGELSNGLFFDFALPGIVRARISDTNISDESPAQFNYLFGVGYPFDIGNYDMVIEPSVYIKKFRNVPLHVDINALMKFIDGKLVSGVTYSTGADNRLGFLIGTQLNSLRFNYSYNITFHDSQQFNNGGHEIGIGIIIDPNKRIDVPMEDK